jgi:hypothetical protein
MNRNPPYQIERPAPGLVAYREGCKEHQFPVRAVVSLLNVPLDAAVCEFAGSVSK